MKVLFWDVETSHMLLAQFGLWNEGGTSHDNIIEDWYMMCAAWKWQGQKRVHAVSVADDKKRFAKNPHDDYHVIKTLHEVLSQADVVVGHNGDAFDMKKFNARAIYHGLPPLPPIQSVDTLKEARKTFKFSSNRLDYIGQYLGVGQKMSTPKGLWLKVYGGCKKSLETMVKYNKQDVNLLEDVYNKLRPYMPSHPNANVFKDPTHADGCPCCSSQNYQLAGTRATKTGRYQRYQCQDCGSWFKGQVDKSLKVDLKK